MSFATGDLNRFNAGLWPDVMMEIILPLMTNMRDVRRFATSVRPTMAAIRDQVELVDVLALEAVRVFLPDVFFSLANSRGSLTTTFSFGYGGSESPKLKVGIDTVLQVAGEHVELVKNLLRRTFPASIRHFENTSYGPDWESRWLRERRVAHADVLQLYLERTIPDGLASFAEAERVFAHIEDAVAFRATLEVTPLDDLADVIGQLAMFEGTFPVDGVVPGVSTLLNLLPKIPDRPRTMFGLDNRLTVSRVVYLMFKQFEGDEPTAERLVDEIWANLERLSSKLELLLTVGHIEGAGHKFISEQRAGALEIALAEEIAASTDQDLMREQGLLRLLRAPVNWDGAVVRTIDLSAPLVLHFQVFRSAVGEVTSQAMGSRHVQRTATLSWDSLVGVYGDEATIGAVLNAMNSEPEPGTEALRELIGSYLDGWRPERL